MNPPLTQIFSKKLKKEQQPGPATDLLALAVVLLYPPPY